MVWPARGSPRAPYTSVHRAQNRYLHSLVNILLCDRDRSRPLQCKLLGKLLAHHLRLSAQYSIHRRYKRCKILPLLPAHWQVLIFLLLFLCQQVLGDSFVEVSRQPLPDPDRCDSDLILHRVRRESPRENRLACRLHRARP